ncbi:MAG: M48 family metallopeptidase [Phycisphaerales bacterium]
MPSPLPPSTTYIDLIAKNKRQSVVLMILMIALLALVGGIIAASLSMGNPQALIPSVIVGIVAALITGGLGALWSYYAGANAILRMSGAQEISPTDDPELFNVVDEVRIAAGLPMPRVFIINDTALNAFATGRDPQHAAVAITTGLRRTLPRDQLQAVMAHEVAHIRHFDIRFSLLMATMIGLIAFACDAFLRITLHSLRFGGGSRGRGKNGGGVIVFMLVLLVVAAILAIFAPLIGRFIQMAFSREREYLADAGAVELTRNPEAMIGALESLSRDRDPFVDHANRGTAHMFIVNPLRKMHASGQALDSAFSSHPPIAKRIDRLRALLR